MGEKEKGGKPARRKFRNEWKYLISDWEAYCLRERLAPFLNSDAHAENGTYMIRSLYFDDFWDSAYNEKMMGINDRLKWRIRFYNCTDSAIKLERKIKDGSYIHKDSASLTRKETDDIVNGNCDFLLHHPEPLCQEFYVDWYSKVLRPKVIVDYDREPLILQAGEVRITFDRKVRAAICGFDIFDPGLPTLDVLEPGVQILEVKFTEFLPGVVRKLLPLDGQEFTAVSKYTLCYERAYHLTDALAGVMKTNRRRRI